MEEQLPVPYEELFVFNLYLGSVTYFLIIGIIAYLIYKQGKFSWIQFVSIAIILILTANIFSLWIWSIWPSYIDIMFGPINLPALTAAIPIGLILIKLFKIRSRNEET